MLTALIAFTALLTAIFPATAAEPREAVPLEGKRFSAELIAADAKWELTFRAGQEERKLAAADLVAWGAPVEPKGRSKLDDYFPPAELLLEDGGLVVADLKESKGETLFLASDALGSLELGRQQVRGILFGPPLDRQRRDELANRLLEPDGKTDRLILHNGDVVSGKVQGFTQTISPERQRQFLVEVVVGGATIKVTADRIAGVSFAPRGDAAGGARASSERRPDELYAILGFRDGTRLVAKRLELTADQAAIESAASTGAGSQTWKASRAELVYLQPLGGKAVYLSDLVVPTALDDSGEARGTPVGRASRQKAAIYKYVPLLSATWPYYADRSVRGAHLRSGGRLWLKGLGMHSGGALTIALPVASRRFDAEIALDDSVGQRGSVVFEVKVYGRKEGRVAVLRTFTSETIRGGAPPTPVSVDLDGAVGLSLGALFGERGDELDHANWLNARLVP